MSDVDWASLLVEGDVEGLWNGLFQLVTRHPAVRPLRFATDGAAVASQVEINADLTQELFLELFQKQRFDHYADNGYSSTDIENELARIEVPNLVGARLRKRYPESFRMARRVSSLLKASSRFRRFGADDSSSAPRRRGRPRKDARPPEEDDSIDDGVELLEEGEDGETQQTRPKRSRMVNQIFGLREWTSVKPMTDPGRHADSIKSVSIRPRDTRVVGRSGTSQLILSNPELEKLIVEVFRAIDSPADVRTLRQLVLSKIPLQDYNIASLDEEFTQGTDGGSYKREAVDLRRGPEAELLRNERDGETARLANEFLGSLRRAVNNNERRYARLLSTLWHCYYDPDGPSQLEIAEKLGVSDSLVSDNRRLIEYELKKLKLTREEGAVFSESLQQLVSSNMH